MELPNRHVGFGKNLIDDITSRHSYLRHASRQLELAGDGHRKQIISLVIL